MPEELKKRLTLTIPIDSEAGLRDYAKLADVVKLFQSLIPYVKNLRPELKQDILDQMRRIEERLQAETDRSIKSKTDALDARMTAHQVAMYAAMAECEAAVSEHITPQMLQDAFDALRSEMPILDTPEQVRDKLEELKGEARLDKSAIKGLGELEKSLTDRIAAIPSRGGGGTSAIGVAQAFKYIAHTEQPVGAINGVNVTYTVKNNIWWIAGFTLNGEQIAELPNFTTSGRTITFSTAIPADYSGKDFECKYIGT